MSPEELAKQIIDECVEGDTDTSYGYALNCDAYYLATKIVDAIKSQLQAKDDRIKELTTALDFYAANRGLTIDFKTNVFRSLDSDECDFHGAKARAALKGEK